MTDFDDLVNWCERWVHKQKHYAKTVSTPFTLSPPSLDHQSQKARVAFSELLFVNPPQRLQTITGVNGRAKRKQYVRGQSAMNEFAGVRGPFLN